MTGAFQDLLRFLVCVFIIAASTKEASGWGGHACITVGGISRNKECVFPFKNPYNGAEHKACTYDHGLPAWCATRVNNDGTMAGLESMGFCGSGCEVEKNATCYASLSKTASK